MMDRNVLDMCGLCVGVCVGVGVGGCVWTVWTVCVSGEDHILMTILIEPNVPPSQQSALFQSLFTLPESELSVPKKL